MGWNCLSIPKRQRLHRWSLGMDKWSHPTHYRACDCLSMLGLGLNHVSKSDHWYIMVWLYMILCFHWSTLLKSFVRKNSTNRRKKKKKKKNPKSYKHRWLMLQSISWLTVASLRKPQPRHARVMASQTRLITGNEITQIGKFMGPTWDPSGSCRPQMGPTLAPGTLLSGLVSMAWRHQQLIVTSSAESNGTHNRCVRIVFYPL